MYSAPCCMHHIAGRGVKYCNFLNQPWVSLGKLTLGPQLLGYRGTATVRGSCLIQSRESCIKPAKDALGKDESLLDGPSLESKGQDVQPKCWLHYQVSLGINNC